MNTRAIRMTSPKNPSIVIAISTSRAKRSPRTRKDLYKIVSAHRDLDKNVKVNSRVSRTT